MEITERTLLKALLGVTLLLATCTAVTLVILWNRAKNNSNELRRQITQIKGVVDTNHRVLCLTKADDIRSLHTAVMFLEQNPNGTQDFSRAFILMTIRQDRVRLRNLVDVTCSPAQLRH